MVSVFLSHIKAPMGRRVGKNIVMDTQAINHAYNTIIPERVKNGIGGMCRGDGDI